MEQREFVIGQMIIIVMVACERLLLQNGDRWRDQWSGVK